MLIFFIITGAAFALVFALFAAYTLGHSYGYAKGEDDYQLRNIEALLVSTKEKQF